MPTRRLNGQTYDEIAIVTAAPVPVDIGGGAITIEGDVVVTDITIENTSANPVPVSDAGGSLTIDDGGLSITVDGPLTDQQLRATPIRVATSALPSTPTTTSVASTTTSVQLLAANSNRKGLLIHNQSDGILFLSFSTPANVENSFLCMTSGSVLLLDQQLIVANAIHGIWSLADGTAQVTEMV